MMKLEETVSKCAYFETRLAAQIAFARALAGRASVSERAALAAAPVLRPMV